MRKSSFINNIGRIMLIPILFFTLSTNVLADDDDNDRRLVLVDNVDGLLENIGRDNIELALAPGAYVIPYCSGGLAQEMSDPTCGEMQQGDNSVLRSNLQLELDENGAPTGQANGGAIIDCSGLPPSALKYSCLVAGGGSTIRNLTISNGLNTPDPDPPGGEAQHRNAIMIVAGKAAVVDEVHLMNARRGVLFTTESGKETRGVVRHSLIDGTELAGIFLHAVNPDGVGSSNSQLIGAAHANRLTNIGLHPILHIWAFLNASGHHSHVEFTENIVDSSNIFGITFEALGFSGVPTQNNTASFRVAGGSLEGSQGLTMLTFGDGGDNSNNCIAGQVEGLTIENGEPAVEAFLAPGWGNGNKFLIEMMNSAYISNTSAGKVLVTDDAGNDFQIAGTPEEFLEDNTNFDISDVLLDFTGDTDLCVLTPTEALQGVISDLQDIIDTHPETPLADKVEDVLSKLRVVLDELEKEDYQAAVGNMEGAVGDLEAAVSDGLLDPAEGGQLMDSIAAIAREIAVNARDQAIAQGGDPGKINSAQQALAEGDALRASGAFKDAVSKFKVALAEAEGALP